MVPEKWSPTDRMFLSFWAIYCPFTPLKTRKIKILEKMKKKTKNKNKTGYIIILHQYTTNNNHMMYGS